MTVPLYEYQVEGAQWLARGPRVRLLADDMGIGKTAQAIAGCDLVGAETVTVICPAVMRQQWKREFLRFSKHVRKITVLSDEHKERVPLDGVVICSFEFASAVAKQLTLSLRKTDVVIIDESHMCKERDSLRTRAIYGDNCDGKGGIVEDAARVWALTGTPMPNNAGELWPILRLSGEYAGGYWQYMREFTKFVPTKHGFRVTEHVNKPTLRKHLGNIMLRRLRDEVLTDMPGLTIGDLIVKGVDVSIGRPILDALAEEEPRYAAALESAMKTNDWSLREEGHIVRVRRMIGLAKVRPIASYIRNELAANPHEKFIVFAIHREVLKYLAAYIGGRTRILWGGTPEDKRQRYIDSFQTNSHRQVMLCQIKAAGMGITLTAANRVLIAEPSWTPGDNFQAIMRAYRLGQRRHVRADFVSLEGSIDAAVNKTLRTKAEVIASILG